MAQRIPRFSEDIEKIFEHPKEYVGDMTLMENVQQLGFDMTTLSGRVVEHKHYIYALHKIIDEILTNAADNALVDKTQSNIRIVIGVGGSERNNGLISIENDGTGIPNTKDKKRDIYIPTGIFTHLGISANFESSGTNKAAGQYGIGATATTAFSEFLTIENTDSGTKTKFTQTFKVVAPKKSGERWKFTMTEPKLVKLKGKNVKGKVKVTFKPSFSRLLSFGDNLISGKNVGLDDKLPESLYNDLVESQVMFLYKRAAEIRTYIGRKMNVYLNGKRLDVASFKDFAKSISNVDDDAILYKKIQFQVSKSRINAARKLGKKSLVESDVPLEWEYVVTDPFLAGPRADKAYTIVNAIPVTNGIHVASILDTVASELQKMIKQEVSGKKLSRYLFFFIKAPMLSPKFSGKTKEYLDSPSYSIPSASSSKSGRAPPEAAKMRKFARDIIQKFRLTERVKVDLSKAVGAELAKGLTASERSRLRSTDNHMAVNASRIPKSERKLLVVEGNSAKNAAVNGRTAIGKAGNSYGIYKLRGKIQNVRKTVVTSGREKGGESKSKRRVVQEFLVAVGLDKVLGKTLSPKQIYNRLNYSKVIFFTDQDVDGYHIRGLLLNLFHILIPKFLKSKEGKGFLNIFSSPIVRIREQMGRGKVVKEFFTTQSYEAYLRSVKSLPRGQIAIYYKGLASATESDNKMLFKNLDHYIRPIVLEPGSDKLLEMMFSEDSGPRKNAINKYDPNRVIDVTKLKEITVEEFIYGELMHFSFDDMCRHLPDLYDGMSPVLRKIVYATRIFKPTNIKVSALAGKIMDMNIYHHGEASLAGSILSSAVSFIGSNLPLTFENAVVLNRTNSDKKKDMTAPRYAYVSKSDVIDKLFPPQDDPLLVINPGEDPKYGEPVRYIPIIPLLFAHGIRGTGTGWSALVPPYNIFELIEFTRMMITDKEIKMNPANIIPDRLNSTFHQNVPIWFANFTGRVMWSGKSGEYRSYIIISNYEYDKDTRELIVHDPPPVSTNLSYIDSTKYVNSAKFVGYFDSGGVSIVSNPETKLSFTGRVDKKFAKTFACLNDKDVVGRNGKLDITTPKYKLMLKIGMAVDIKPSVKMLNCIDASNTVVTFKQPSAVLIPWFTQRLYLYKERKKYEIAEFDMQIAKLSSRITYINEIVEKKINLKNMTRENLIDMFLSRPKDFYQDKGVTLINPDESTGIEEIGDGSDAGDDDNGDIENTGDTGDTDNDDTKSRTKKKPTAATKKEQKTERIAPLYSYMTNMPMLSLTSDRRKKFISERDELIKNRDAIKKKKISTIWSQELDELSRFLNKMYTEMRRKSAD